MNKANMNIPIEIMQTLGKTVVPPDAKGTWVMVSGNRHARRYERLPSFLSNYNIEHGDFVWVTGEKCPWKLRDTYFGMRLRKKKGNEAMFFTKISKSELNDVEFLETFMRTEMVTEDQLTTVTIPGPWPEKPTLWCGEVRPVSYELINELVDTQGLVVVPFKPMNEIMDREIAELADAMEVDGATREYATANLMLGSLIDEEPFFFLKSTGWYREQFCEVIEHTTS